MNSHTILMIRFQDIGVVWREKIDILRAKLSEGNDKNKDDILGSVGRSRSRN